VWKYFTAAHFPNSKPTTIRTLLYLISNLYQTPKTTMATQFFLQRPLDVPHEPAMIHQVTDENQFPPTNGLRQRHATNFTRPVPQPVTTPLPTLPSANIRVETVPFRTMPRDEREEAFLAPLLDLSISDKSIFQDVRAARLSNKRKHHEISEDTLPTASSSRAPPNLNKLPTELTAMIFESLDKNSAVSLSLTSKKLYNDYIFTFRSIPMKNLSRWCTIDPGKMTLTPPLYHIIATWMGPNYHYNSRTNTFLNNLAFPSGSMKEWELQVRYMDYERSEQQLPRPYEMPKEEWEEKAKAVIQSCSRKSQSFTRWFDFWSATEIFQRNRRERGFLTGVGDTGGLVRKKRRGMAGNERSVKRARR